MTLVLELNRPWQWTPGVFRSTVIGRPFRRVWWGPVALAWMPHRFDECLTAAAEGRVIWWPPAPPAGV